MDALSALSAAGSIMQLADFGLCVVSKGRRIYRSVDGSLAENLDLEVVTNDLLLMHTKLQCPPLDSSNALMLSEDTKAFDTLAAVATETASKLLEKLNMVKAQGRFRAWKSLRQALKSVCSKADVQEMAERLQWIRGEMQLRLLVILKNHAMVELIESAQLSDKLDKASLQVLQALKDKSDLFDTSLNRQTEHIEGRLADSEELLRQVKSDLHESMSRVGDGLEQSFQTLASGYDRQRLEDDFVIPAIIRSLCYAGMEDRFENVEDAHSKSFSWIFEPDENCDGNWDSFPSWLEKGESIYWVTGKAASGKSTLLKFIILHPGLRQHLDIWTGDTPLAVSSFYFCGTGTPNQKSQTGLFRSILHQIFLNDLRMVRAVLHSLIESTLTMPTGDIECLRLQESWHHWSLVELKRIFLAVLSQSAFPTNHCVFIDGLDEFDGDCHELTSFLIKVAQLSNVKLCLSSRPLLNFESELRNYPKLRLQDLTRRDIARVVRDKLSSHSQFHSLAEAEPSLCLKLTEAIVETSSGVFLWVTLVIRSLLDGLTNKDNLSDLMLRLRALPSELDGLYSLMLHSIQPSFYKAQASRLFQLVCRSDAPLLAAELSFADDPNEDLPLMTRVGSITMDEMAARRQAISSRLGSRCAGLLEIRGGASGHVIPLGCGVQYLHLTVKEFLEQPDVWSKLHQLTKPQNFDANTSLLRAMLMMLKARYFIEPKDSGCECIKCYRKYGYSKTHHNCLSNLQVQEHNRWGLAVRTLIGRATDFAVQAEDGTGRAQTALVEELDRTASILISRAKTSDKRVHWASHMHHASQICGQCPGSFFAYAINKGLTLYVKQQLSRQSSDRQCLPLLYHATSHCPRVMQEQTFHPSMVAMLFKAGCDPNERYQDSTPWQTFLGNICKIAESRNRKSLDSSCLDVCKLFVMAGADLNINPRSIRYSRHRTLLEITEWMFQHLPPESTLELHNLITDRQASSALGNVAYSMRLPLAEHSRYTGSIEHRPINHYEYQDDIQPPQPLYSNPRYGSTRPEHDRPDMFPSRAQYDDHSQYTHDPSSGDRTMMRTTSHRSRHGREPSRERQQHRDHSRSRDEYPLSRRAYEERRFAHRDRERSRSPERRRR